VLFCEDDAVNDGDTHPLAPGITDVNRLIGLGPKGEPFPFAVNVLNVFDRRVERLIILRRARRDALAHQCGDAIDELLLFRGETEIQSQGSSRG